MLIPTLVMSESARSAERIYASYSALELSIPVTALEIFAQKGEIDGENKKRPAQQIAPEGIEPQRP